MSESYVNLSNARNNDQKIVMETINAHGHCPFCFENLKQYHKEPILRQGKHWLITKNQWPYDNTDYHFLAISRYHAESLRALRPGSFDELLDAMQWLEKTNAISSGGLTMRFGDVGKNGASVRHLHMHMIVPKADLSGDQKVRFKIS